MRSRRDWSLFLVAAVALIGAGGCGQKDPLNRQAVSGKVTLDGAPVEQGSIEFAPRGAQARTRGGAVIKAGGYQVPRHQGLPPGEYLVRIYAPEGTAASNPSEPPGPGVELQAKERVPAKYNTQSELIVQVTEKGANQFDFPLQTQ